MEIKTCTAVPMPKNKIKKMLLEKRVNKMYKKEDLQEIEMIEFIRPRNKNIDKDSELKKKYEFYKRDKKRNDTVLWICSLTSGVVMSALYYALHPTQIGLRKLSMEEQQAIKTEFLDYKASLVEKYPKLDLENVDINNILQSLKTQYEDCFTPGRRNYSVTVKDGWSSYYVDYKNGLSNDVVHSLNDMCGGNAIIEHSYLIQSLEVGAITAVIFGAVLYMVGSYYPQKTMRAIQASAVYKKAVQNAKTEQEFKENVHKLINGECIDVEM